MDIITITPTGKKKMHSKIPVLPLVINSDLYPATVLIHHPDLEVGPV
jgi:hypothetical protein